MSRITVSVIKEEDVEWLVETAAVKMLEDELLRPELINFKQLYLLAEKVLLEGSAFIAKDEDVYVGALAAILVPNLYNPDIKTFAELFWYVLPTYRNTRAGFLLLSAFDTKAKECADESTLSLLGSSTINTETLSKRGFILNEYAFRKEYRRN